MKDLVARTNKRSVNWLADRLLMTVGAEASGSERPSLERGVEAMLRWLDGRGVSSKEIVLDTGSGLSHKTKITARHIVRALRAAAGFTSQLSPQSLLDPSVFVASLAVGGVDGTLRGRFRSALVAERDAAGHVRVGCGTPAGVDSTTASGDQCSAVLVSGERAEGGGR